MERHIESEDQVGGGAGLSSRPPPIERRDFDPFGELDRIAILIGRMYEAHRDDASSLEARAYRIAYRILDVVNLDGAAAMGDIHTRHDRPYAVLRSLQKGVWTAYLCATLGVPEDERAEVIAAAMSANLAMASLQNVLERQESGPTPQQREVIRRHPEESAAMLEARGVTSRLWLRTVREHHERLDGSGYPAGLRGSEIAKSAMLVGFSDTLTAMITPGGVKRAPRSPASALAELTELADKAYPRSLIYTVCGRLGAYPPGTAVRMADGSLAVVLRPGEDPRRPYAAMVVRPDGTRVARPRPLEACRISAVLPVSELPALDHANLWGYSRRDRWL